LLVVTKLLTAKLHSCYVKESESGVDVAFGNSGKVRVGVGVGHFTSDFATLAFWRDIISCGGT